MMTDMTPDEALFRLLLNLMNCDAMIVVTLTKAAEKGTQIALTSRGLAPDQIEAALEVILSEQRKHNVVAAANSIINSTPDGDVRETTP